MVIRILLLECSPHEAASQGSRLARELAQRIDPQARLVLRNLVSDPLPPITAEYAEAIGVPTPDGAPCFITSERLIDELEASDCLLIATPMHNFTVPAALKLWIDHVVRIRRSFRVTPHGKQGLLQDRPTFVFISSGGYFQGERAKQPDFLTPYLRHVLSTIGLQTVEFIPLQGLSGGEMERREATRQARQQMEKCLISRTPVTGETHE